MDYWILLWSFILILGINLIFFLIAFVIKTDIFTDITYSLSFVVVAAATVIWKQNFSPVQITLFVLYNVWAFRAGIYLFIRILKTKVDHRFDKMRDHFFKFGTFWILQALSVFIISMPTVFALSINESYFSTNFNYYSLIFIVLAVMFLTIETIADWQKYRFHINNKSQNNDFIDYGMWKNSRHPNYFGEIGFWYMLAGMFLLDFLTNNHGSVSNYLQLLWLISPIYINLLLVFVSGVPLLEVSSAKKLWNNKAYQAYLAKTPCLVFLIGKRGPIAKVKKMKLQK